MTTALKNGYQGLTLLIQLNSDRLITGLALGVALFVAAYLGSH